MPQKRTAAKKKKADSNDPKDDSEIIAVANLQRVQNLLERRQNKDAGYVRPNVEYYGFFITYLYNCILYLQYLYILTSLNVKFCFLFLFDRHREEEI